MEVWEAVLCTASIGESFCLFMCCQDKQVTGEDRAALFGLCAIRLTHSDGFFRNIGEDILVSECFLCFPILTKTGMHIVPLLTYGWSERWGEDIVNGKKRSLRER